MLYPMEMLLTSNLMYKTGISLGFDNQIIMTTS